MTNSWNPPSNRAELKKKECPELPTLPHNSLSLPHNSPRLHWSTSTIYPMYLRSEMGSFPTCTPHYNIEGFFPECSPHYKLNAVLTACSPHYSVKVNAAASFPPVHHITMSTARTNFITSSFTSNTLGSGRRHMIYNSCHRRYSSSQMMYSSIHIKYYSCHMRYSSFHIKYSFCHMSSSSCHGRYSSCHIRYSSFHINYYSCHM